MKPLLSVLRMMLAADRPAVWRGALLSLAVLLMGLSLLGLSGWFVTAAAAAGLAGLGATFDVFRPSAMVRFLALARTAARYGERMLTHDATLGALLSLRLRILSGYLALPWLRMLRLRGPEALNRLIADVEALDGLLVRLVLPLLSGALTLIIAFGVLWWLVDIRVALVVAGTMIIGAALIFWRVARATMPLARRAEAAGQAARLRLVDLIRGREELAAHGRLVDQAASVARASLRRRRLRQMIDRRERLAGLALHVTASLAAAGALWFGLTLVARAEISPALAALGFFAALALAEAIHPIRRAGAEIGRMADAARRVAPLTHAAPGNDAAPSSAPVPPVSTALGQTIIDLRGLTIARPGSSLPMVSDLSFAVKAGEMLAIKGESGIGKSTLLQTLAGLLPPLGGEITLLGQPLSHWAEADLRARVTYLPQRSALMAGTIRAALELAAPDETDAAFQAALDAVQLSPVIAARGGLSMMLGPQGRGLSGGEARRLVLARAILRKPALLLLDEPTEGLDLKTAQAVLSNLRRLLPEAAIITASHRPPELDAADRVLALGAAG